MSAPAWSTNRPPRRSSISTPPLRLPGQSVDERMSVLQTKIDDLLIAPLCFVVVAGYGWIQMVDGTSPPSRHSHHRGAHHHSVRMEKDLAVEVVD